MADIKKPFADLRKPFPAESIGQLPKAGIKLDYVGHAAVTDRLLEVDPEWTWEPFALTESGHPALDSKGNLWIKLTVLGVTRPGVGDGSSSMKELIGDALRNAAMRFGVALDLWSKEELESIHEGKVEANDKPSSHAPAASAEATRPKATVQDEPLARAKVDINDGLEALGITAVIPKKNFIREVIGQSSIDTVEQAHKVMDAIDARAELESA